MCADLLVAGDKYEAVSMDNGYNKYMMLKIRSVSRSDFGSYQCVAKNSLGETDGLIKLDGNIHSVKTGHFNIELFKYLQWLFCQILLKTFINNVHDTFSYDL